MTDRELMQMALGAGDSVLMNEQAALLRECRAALDSLIAQKPTLAGLLCGSTTLGNLKAELGAYRPQGVFRAALSPQQRKWVGLTDEDIVYAYCTVSDKEWALGGLHDARVFSSVIEAALKEKNA